MGKPVRKDAVPRLRDRDGDVWTVSGVGTLIDDTGMEMSRLLVEKKWGPLTPINPPNLWKRVTADWPGRLAVVGLAVNLAALLVVTVLAIIRADPSLYLNVSLPLLGITIGFPLLLTGLFKTLTWIWPSMSD